MDEREHGDMDIDPGRETWWGGTASGGPIDGSEIRIGAAPFVPMRGLHVNICIGDDVETADWHLYAFKQKFDEVRGVVGIFEHWGAIDGDPKLPQG